MEQRLGSRPDFVIIGAMKCATSTLHDQLGAHNSFFMVTPKEPNFFSDDDKFIKGIGWYESLFAKANSGQVKGESSTHYSKLPTYPETLKRLVSFCPEVKCIYMMRHPVDRLVSHYIHEWTQQTISCDINKAVDRFPELIDYGLYAMQIEPYLEALGPTVILPIFTERLHDNPVRELRRVFQFLGVDEKPVWHVDIHSNVSSERLQVCGWRDAILGNTALGYIRRTFVPKIVRTAVKSLWTMKKRPELSSKSLAHVVKIFNDDLNKLGMKFNFELTCENYKETVLNRGEIEWI